MESAVAECVLCVWVSTVIEEEAADILVAVSGGKVKSGVTVVLLRGRGSDRSIALGMIQVWTG